MNLGIHKESGKTGLHRLSPYTGKVRPELAHYLIKKYSSSNGNIFDPFSGSGTIPLEGWISGRDVYANDLSKYGYVLTSGKLNPPKSLERAVKKLNKFNDEVKIISKDVKLTDIPKWVRAFFHNKTLKETVAWSNLLNSKKEWFYLSCLLGILHHQRPGFLSYPACHGAPYLRTDKFPQAIYPELYSYRDVFTRLLKKVQRSFNALPKLDYSLERKVTKKCASTYSQRLDRVHTIITSPPYMKSLTYARDNRLRLWFLGENDWRLLENKISPSKKSFLDLIGNSLRNWSLYQKKGDRCIIIIGKLIIDRKNGLTLSDYLVDSAKSTGYSLEDIIVDPIPDDKRMVKNQKGVKEEEIIILRRGK